MGIAIPIALERRRAAGQAGFDLYLQLARRTAALFGLGLFLALFPFYNWIKGDWIHIGDMRIMGVLQRLALCFFFASILFLWLRPRGLLIAAFALLLGYWAIMTLIPVPGIGAPNLEKETNLASWLDGVLLEGHMYRGTITWDPEGVLSTIPSIVNGIIGLLIGQILQREISPKQKAVKMYDKIDNKAEIPKEVAELLKF